MGSLFYFDLGKEGERPSSHFKIDLSSRTRLLWKEEEGFNTILPPSVFYFLLFLLFLFLIIRKTSKYSSNKTKNKKIKQKPKIKCYYKEGGG